MVRSPNFEFDATFDPEQDKRPAAEVAPEPVAAVVEEKQSFLRRHLWALLAVSAFFAGEHLLSRHAVEEKKAAAQRVSASVPGASEGLEELPLTDADYREAIDRVKGSIVCIEGSKTHGTGFRIAPDYILTNRHVLEENEMVATWSVRPPLLLMPTVPVPGIAHLDSVHGPNYALTMYAPDDREKGVAFRAVRALGGNGLPIGFEDVALLHIPPDEQVKLPPFRKIPLGAPETGRSVFTIGYPRPFQPRPIATFGKVSRETVILPEDTEMANVMLVATDAAINPGNSGGMIFQMLKFRDKSGKVTLDVTGAGVSTFFYQKYPALSFGIQARQVAYVSTTQWGIPLMDEQEMKDFQRDFPEFAHPKTTQSSLR